MSSRALVTCDESRRVFRNRLLGSRNSSIDCNKPKLTKLISKNDLENPHAQP